MDRFFGVTPAAVGVGAVCLAYLGCFSSTPAASAVGNDASVDGLDGLDRLDASGLEAGDADAADAGAAPDASDDAQVDGMDEPISYPPVAFLRFATWSADAPAVDVCTAPHGTGAFVGPLVGGLLDGGGTLGEGGSPGLPFPLVTSYVERTPGSYDVRFVVAGAGSCAAPVVSDTTTSLAPDQGTLVALMGDPSGAGSTTAALQVVVFADEMSVNPAGPLRLRFINAALDMSPAALGTGTLAATTFLSLFPAVPFGQAGSGVEDDAAVPGIDDAGYGAVQNLSSSILSAHVTGASTDTIVTMPVSTLAGIPVTLVAVAGSGLPVSLVECLDSAGTSGPLSACSVLP